MTTSSLFFPPDIELGSICRACDIGAGDYYCTCPDQHRCWDCNEPIAFQYEDQSEGRYFHRSCLAHRRGHNDDDE